jgi:hypothetical protein
MNLGFFKKYVNSMYWAVTSFTTVGYGDLHPVTIQEKIFGGMFLFVAIALGTYVSTTIGNLVSPNISEVERYVSILFFTNSVI